MHGTLSANNLETLLKRARHSRKLRLMLPELLGYADARAINDANFKTILSFPKRDINNLAGALGHMDLAFYQMLALNKYPQSYETFSRLFDYVCKYDCFTEQDMRQILADNCDTMAAGFKYCIDCAEEKNAQSDKLKAACEWLKSKNN